MSDPFDKKLVDKINEVFDNFEDDSANENWAELRKRFPEKDKKPSAAIWWLSSAAAILLLCGVWFLTDQKNPAKTKITKSTDKPTINNVDSTNSQIKKSIFPIESKENHTAGNNPKEALESSSLHKVKNLRNNKSVSKPKLVKFAATRTGIEQAADKSVLEESQNDLTLMALIPDPSKKTNSELSASSSIAPDSSKITASATNNQIYPSEVISKEQLYNLIQTDKTKQKPKSAKKLTVGVFAGSYFNYAEGSQTSINTGVGLSSDIKISKKLKISTGVSLGQNSLKYDQLIPKGAALDFASSHNANTALNLSSTQGFSTSSYSINSYDAKLLGLDIPVNLKYTLLEKKNSIYVSTGFSSNLFINESYTYTFDYQMNSNSSTQEPTQQSSSRFQSFDFARVLNFSLGLDHRLNKNTNLTFEPFVKYPLSGLGANDLRFGAAGMNLKLNFNQPK